MAALVLPLGSCGWGAGSGSRSLPVQTLTLQPQPFEDLGDYVATLEAVDAVQLAAVVPGRVRQRLVQEGQQVEQGQVLLQLSSDERRADVAKALADVAQRQADQAAAQAALEQARRNHERYAYLGSEGAASAQELDSYQAEFLAAQAKLKASRDGVRAAEAELATEQSRLADKTVRAPISGQVGDLKVKPGDVVQQGDPFATIVRNEKLFTQISIPATRADQVRVGLPVRLHDPFSAKELGSSSLVFVDPDVNPQTQALLAKAEFSNPSGRLRSGMRVRTQVVFDRREQLAVPFAAVSHAAGQSFVFVLGEASQLEPTRRRKLKGLSDSTVVALKRPVRLGPLQKRCYPVLDGLQPGDQLITTNLLNLRSGTAVKRIPATPATSSALDC